MPKENLYSGCLTKTEAVRRAELLRDELGEGWFFRVWDNDLFKPFKWFYCAESSCGRIHVSPHGGKYHCMISDMRGTGARGWYSDKLYDSPKEAVKASVRKAVRKLAEWVEIVKVAEKLLIGEQEEES